MGKVVCYIALVALAIFPRVAAAQNILTTFGVEAASYVPQVSESLTEVPAVDFLQSGNKYNNFTLTGAPANDARSLTFGWESILEFKKNLFYANVGFGFYSYSFGYKLTLNDTLSSQDFVGAGRSDQVIWDSYVPNSVGVFQYGVTSENIYQLNFGGGYGRSLIMYRGFELALSAKFRVTFRTEPEQDFRYYENNDFVVRSAAGGAIKRLNLYVSPGFSIRKNANILTFNSLYSIGNVNKVGGLSTYRDLGRSIAYTRILGVNKLAKDQYIADSDFAVPDVKSKNYRKGDKSIYIQQLYGISQFTSFLSQSTDTVRGYDPNYGDVNLIIDGYKVSMSNPIDFSFNKHFTDRWMLGFQFGSYREVRSPYGIMEDTSGGYIKDLNLVKDEEFSLENLPDKATSTTAGTFTITSAFYISKHTLPIDPFVQVSLKSALLPSYSEFERQFEVLTDRKNSLTYFTLAVGGDVRIKIRNSRYLLLSGVAEYAFHPEQKYFNAGIRIGYYKNKKFKLKKY